MATDLQTKASTSNLASDPNKEEQNANTAPGPQTKDAGQTIVQDKTMKLGDDINLAEQNDVKLDPNLEKNEYPDLSGAKSLMAKYLTREIFEKLKDKKTSTGFTIARAVNTGVLNKEKSLTGCHAGDVDSYTIFEEFFDPLIEEYHRGFKPSDNHVTDMDHTHLKGNITDPSKIISTRIRVARNISGLRGGVLIQLQKVVEKLGEDGLKKWSHENHLQVRGLYGEHSDTTSAIYDISNKYRLGYSEVQLVQFVIDGVNQLIEMEYH